MYKAANACMDINITIDCGLQPDDHVYHTYDPLGQFSRVDRCSHKVYYKLATLLSRKGGF